MKRARPVPVNCDWDMRVPWVIGISCLEGLDVQEAERLLLTDRTGPIHTAKPIYLLVRASPRLMATDIQG